MTVKQIHCPSCIMGDAEWRPASEKTSIFTCRSARTKIGQFIYSRDFTRGHLEAMP